LSKTACRRLAKKTDGDTKTITDYKEVEGRKFKVTRTYKSETRQVSKAVAHRKLLPKYGDSKNDPPGPNPATTVVAEEIFMQFITLKGGVEESQITDEELAREAKAKMGKSVQCRICKEDHWSAYCPYKDRMPASMLDDAGKAVAAAANAASKGIDSKSDRYVPPSMRDGGNRRGETMPNQRSARDENTVRVTNLSEDVRDCDLEELFKGFGQISRIYLAKDKQTNQSKGFAFVSFYRREHALNAIAHLNGHGYDNLILSVEMANRPNQ